MYIYSLAFKVIINTQMRISKLLGKTWPWGGDRVLWKEYGCNSQDTFRLFGLLVPPVFKVEFKGLTGVLKKISGILGLSL